MQEQISAEQMTEIMDFIYSGQKIAAVKRYMELRNQEMDDMTSLLESKKFVEQLTAELREKYPERFTATQSGCSVTAILLIALTARGLWYFI